MTTTPAPDPGTALSLRPGQQEFNDAQVATLNQLGITDASRADLAIFFHQAVRTGLDPFAKQIYMIGRNAQNPRTKQWEVKYTIQTGIDGYRLIARRAADHAHETLGYDDTVWCGEDGVWHDVWLARTPPSAAKVTVVRNGERFSATALWNEYVQSKKDGAPTSMWQRMSSTMLAKCAEALALRKAFPQDLSGIYTMEEMAQADNETAVAPAQQRQHVEQTIPVDDVVDEEPDHGPAAVLEPDQPTDAAVEQVNRYRSQQEQPAAQVDWSAAFVAAAGNKDALTALRNQGRRAHLPATYGMFDAIAAELARIASETPVEGKLVEA